MTNPLAAADFFALEAGECLDRLETLRSGRPTAARRGVPANRAGPPRLGAHGRPATDRTRGGRARGARARVPRRAPPCGTRPRGSRLGQAIEEFRLLVRRVREWGETGDRPGGAAWRGPGIPGGHHRRGRTGSERPRSATSARSSTPACGPSWRARAPSSRAPSTGPPARFRPRPAIASRSTPSSGGCSRFGAWPS